MYNFYILFIILVFFIPLTNTGSESIHVHKRCYGKLNIETIIMCTLDHSPEYRLAKLDWETNLGRRKTAGYLFPSNPVVSATTANRRMEGESFPPSSGKSVLNGEILFSQEIYTAGKRSAQIKIADAEMQTAFKRIEAMERVTIAESIQSTILYQASAEEYELTKELYELSQSIARIAKIRFQNGLGSEMDSELAESESLKMLSQMEMAKRNKETRAADLAVMMGIPYLEELPLEKETTIFSIPKISRDDYTYLAENQRPDLESLKMEILISKSRERLLEKNRIPNVTFSGYFQNDGFNERVVGARVSIPLTIWRDNSGEIQSAKAITKKNQANQEIGEHSVRLEALNAWNGYRSWKRAWDAYPSNILQRTNENLNIIKKAVEMGSLSIRDAILTQKSLIELKSNYFKTKTGYALASAEYLRAGGISYSEYFKQTPELQSIKTRRIDQ